MADEEADAARHRPCSGLRQELLNCLRESDCVRVHGLSPRECLQDGRPGQNSDCKALQVAFFECKRSLGLRALFYLLTMFYGAMIYKAQVVVQEHCMKLGIAPALDNRQRFRGRKGY